MNRRAFLKRAVVVPVGIAAAVMLPPASAIKAEVVMGPLGSTCSTSAVDLVTITGMHTPIWDTDANTLTIAIGSGYRPLFDQDEEED